MSATFTCAVCKETFASAWSDDEARAELRSNFGNVPVEQCALACEDCVRKGDLLRRAAAFHRTRKGQAS